MLPLFLLNFPVMETFIFFSQKMEGKGKMDTGYGKLE